ncbi:hypothetical protein P7C70_g9394, partial [Phenoliferia sp. Uapishka_3]
METPGKLAMKGAQVHGYGEAHSRRRHASRPDAQPLHQLSAGPNASSSLSTIPSSSSDPMAMSPVAARRASSYPSHSPPSLRTTGPVTLNPCENRMESFKSLIARTHLPVRRIRRAKSPAFTLSQPLFAASPTSFPSLPNDEISPFLGSRASRSVSAKLLIPARSPTNRQVAYGRVANTVSFPAAQQLPTRHLSSARATAFFATFTIAVLPALTANPSPST